MIIIINRGLFPMTILVRIDLMMETGQLQAKHKSITISQMLIEVFIDDEFYFFRTAKIQIIQIIFVSLHAY